MAYSRRARKAAKPVKKVAAAQTPASRWCQEIERYERGTSKWREQTSKIVKIYLNEHRKEGTSDERRFALLWANIETMKPAVYARLPVAVVSRRFKDSDPVARKASEVLERCINTSFDLYGVHEVMENVRDDRLLAARGTAWVRYEAEFEDMPDAPTPADPAVAPTDPAEPAQRVAAEKVCFDFVHWSDFGHTLNRTWKEVTAVWRRVYLTKDQVKARKFTNEEATAALSYEVRAEYAEKYGSSDKDACEPQAVIHEIWDKTGGQTIWLVKEGEVILEQGDPPLDFRDFFPCPKPTYGTTATGSLIPKSDYLYYQDQAEEIDDLTNQIAELTSWLRLKGFIATGPSSEGSDAIKQLMKLQSEVSGKTILVPVESWSGFSEKGGSKGVIEWLPLDVVAEALREAINARRELKNDVFELTGISDILRGETDPNETLGAQQLKAQTGSRRISTTQRDIARFARDLAELGGEVIAEVFQPETMAEMSGMDLTAQPPPEMVAEAQRLMAQLQAPPVQQAGAPMQQPGEPAPQPPQPDPQVVEQLKKLQGELEEIKLNGEVIALLRDEKTRGFRIEIETDSTVEPDEQREKQSRVEFITAVGGFLREAVPAVQQVPQMAPMAGEMLLFLVRGFRVGRGMEDVIERAMAQIAEAAGQPKQDPEAGKAAAEEAKAKAQLAQRDQQHRQTMEQGATHHQQALAQGDAQHQQKMAQGEQQFQQKLMADKESNAAKTAADQQNRDADRQASTEEREAIHTYQREKDGADREARSKPTVQIDANKALADMVPQIAELAGANAKATNDAAAALMETARGLQAAVEAMLAPREIKLQRGTDGRATGVTSMARTN